MVNNLNLVEHWASLQKITGITLCLLTHFSTQKQKIRDLCQKVGHSLHPPMRWYGIKFCINYNTFSTNQNKCKKRKKKHFTENAQTGGRTW